MLLTGLIAVLSYSVLGYVQARYASYRELTHKEQELALLHARLERGVMEAERLLMQEDGLELLGDEERTTYRKGPEGSILREGERGVDTFQVGAVRMKGTWKDKEVVRGRIDELILELRPFGEALRFRFLREPDAATLMERSHGDRSQ